jgi:hypothetical protein
MYSDDSLDLFLLNLNGEIVLSAKFTSYLKLNIDELQKGIYFIRIINKNVAFTKRILKM